MCPETGREIFWCNRAFRIADGGPIILQKPVAVEEGDTPQTLQKRIMEEAEWKLLPEAVRLFCADKLEVHDNKVTLLEQPKLS